LTGLTGSTGVTGITGVAGTLGATGAIGGLIPPTIEQQAFTMLTAQDGSTSVTCSGGKYAIGGGYTVTSGTPTIFASMPLGNPPTGWQVNYAGDPDEDSAAVVYAVCATIGS
jgi:hypothetical protein